MGHHYVLKRYPLVSSGLLGTPRISHGGFNEKIPCHGNDYRGVKTFQIGDLGRMGPQKKQISKPSKSWLVGGLEHFFRGVGWNHQPVFQNDSTRVPDPQTFELLRRPQNVQVGMRGRKAPGGHQGRFDLEIRLEDGSWILSSQAPILWCFMG